MLFLALNALLLASQSALFLSTLPLPTNAIPTTLPQGSTRALPVQFELSRKNPIRARQAAGTDALTLGHAAANTAYTMPITLGGVELEVIADLGRCMLSLFDAGDPTYKYFYFLPYSTDLIVLANIQDSTNTGVPINASFAIGSGSGTAACLEPV